MLAGHALQGLLANQPQDKSMEMAILAIVSLKIADAVLHFGAMPELPSLTPVKDEEESSKIITPEIILP